MGSVTSLTTGAGVLANTYTLDSFGKTVNSTGTLTNPFRYTARDFDSETGLYYYLSKSASQRPLRFLLPLPVGDAISLKARLWRLIITKPTGQSVNHTAGELD